MTFQEQIKDPRWQKKRLSMLKRDKFTCNVCKSTTKSLNVHHKYYEKGKLYWEYPNTVFLTLCEECHTEEHRKLKEYRKDINTRLYKLDSDELFTLLWIMPPTINKEMGYLISLMLFKDHLRKKFVKMVRDFAIKKGWL